MPRPPSVSIASPPGAGVLATTPPQQQHATRLLAALRVTPQAPTPRSLARPPAW